MNLRIFYGCRYLPPLNHFFYSSLFSQSSSSSTLLPWPHLLGFWRTFLVLVFGFSILLLLLSIRWDLSIRHVRTKLVFSFMQPSMSFSTSCSFHLRSNFPLRMSIYFVPSSCGSSFFIMCLSHRIGLLKCHIWLIYLFFFTYGQ